MAKNHTCTCSICGTKFKAGLKTKKFCSILCQKVALTREIYPDGSDPNAYVECKICGYRGKELLNHIKAYHCSVEEYCEQFGCTEHDLLSANTHNKRSESSTRLNAEGKTGWVKGGKNPAQSPEAKAGRNSIWSKNFHGYDGLTDEEKEAKIHEHGQAAQNTRNTNHTNKLRLDYYTTRGYTEEEAKELLAQRQCTFSLETCIKKYGEKKGKEVFDARQKKWQNTLNSKSPEEKERINRAKMCGGRGYSIISQELFDTLAKQLGNTFTRIFYATNGKPGEFNEYMVTDDYTGKYYFLDFYVADNNKIIEFDGDYWHGEKRGNKERDEQRQKHLYELGYVNMFRVKERDYIDNPDKVVKECLEYLRS